MRHHFLKAIRPALALLVPAVLMSAAPASQPPLAVPGAWPGLWGPSRSGEAAADGRTIRSLREVWRRSTAGGYSEIAVAGGRAITLELRGSDDFIVALDASTGRELWNVRIGPTYRGHGGSDDGPIATPAIDGNDVFAIGPHGHLIAVEAATGRERWRHDLVRDFNASKPGWGFGSSPLVEGNLIVVPTGGEGSRGLLAFDRETGRLGWSAPHAKATAYSSAVPAALAGTRGLVVAAGDRVFAVARRPTAPCSGASLGRGPTWKSRTVPSRCPAIGCC